MAIAVENTWMGSISTGTDISTPIDATDGNTLIAAISKDGSGALTGPSGWTLVQGVTSGTAMRTEIWKREAANDKNPDYLNNSFSVASQESVPRDFSWNNDGTKFFVVGSSSDTVYEYTCSTGFDLSSTVAYSGNSFSISGQEGAVRSISWNDGGTKFFITGLNSTIYEYTCSTGFDLSSTVAYSGNSFSVASQDSTPQGLIWNTGGTKFIIAGGVNDTFYEYTCSTGFDLSSTVAYSGNSFSFAGQSTASRSLDNNADGTKLFLLDGAGDIIYEYTCSTGFDLSSTVAYSGNSYSAEAQETVMNGFRFNDVGNKFHLIGSGNDTVYEYSCPDAYTLNVAPVWTGADEAYALSISEISGAKYSTISAGTSNTGASTAPLSNAVTVNVDNSIILTGFGIDDDSDPLSLAVTLTSLSNINVAGAAGVGQVIGYKLANAGSSGTFTHSSTVSNEWAAFTVLIDSALISVALGIATESDSVQLISVSKAKTIGISLESDVSQSLALVKALNIGQVTETDAAQTGSTDKSKAVGLVSETDFSRAIETLKSLELGLVIESDSVFSLVIDKAVTLGIINETDTAQAIDKAKLVSIAQAIEADSARVLNNAKLIALAQAFETGLAQGMAVLKALSIAQVTETDTAQSLSLAKAKELGLANEANSAFALGAITYVSVNQASETDLSLGVSKLKELTISQASESDLAQTLLAAKLLSIGQASESDTALSSAKSKTVSIVQANETDTALSISTGLAVTINQASEADISNALSVLKSLQVGIVNEANTSLAAAVPASVQVNQVTEIDSTQAIKRVKGFTLAQVSEVDSSLAIEAVTPVSVGLVTETDIAQDISKAKVKSIGQASEADAALIASSLKVSVLGIVTEIDSAQQIDFSKAVSIGLASETDEALAFILNLADNIFWVMVEGSRNVYLVEGVSNNAMVEGSNRKYTVEGESRKIMVN